MTHISFYCNMRETSCSDINHCTVNVKGHALQSPSVVVIQLTEKDTYAPDWWLLLNYRNMNLWQLLSHFSEQPV